MDELCLDNQLIGDDQSAEAGGGEYLDGPPVRRALETTESLRLDIPITVTIGAQSPPKADPPPAGGARPDQPPNALPWPLTLERPLTGPNPGLTGNQEPGPLWAVVPSTGGSSAAGVAVADSTAEEPSRAEVFSKDSAAGEVLAEAASPAAGALPPVQESLQEVACFLRSVLESPRLPEETPPIITQNQDLQYLFNVLVSLRRVLAGMAKGDFSMPVAGRGYIAGSIKALLANLRHLIWQTRQVAEGDFSQRVQFLGDFSASFNQMTRQLETTLKKLRENEASLLKKNQELSAEIQYRIHIEDALRESERNYQQMSTQDPLTGVYNRRYFWLAGEQEIRRGSRSGTPLSLLMLDIDFFKAVNDRYGHVVGDEVLIKFASYLVAQLRSSDVVVRYGGEEFLIILPDTSLLLACDLAERLRMGIEENPMILDSGQTISITISAGVSLVDPKSGGNPQDILDRAVKQADDALYKAKNSGRNQVVCAKPASS